ncbi:FtsK/SpoIIIE domain-containing protein [Streptomyces xiamenensis]|nr:FtsK/SpoIIIE domain-containing protein [Streptomyces xiamenensis]
MRLSLTVVDPVAGHRVDGVLDADPQIAVADLVPEFLGLLGAHAQQPADVMVFVDGAPVDPALSLERSPLREGVVVSLRDPAGCPPLEPTGIAELRVVGGPAAGAVHRLGVGRIDIGQGAVPIRVNDPELAGRALTLRIMADGTASVQAHDTAITIDGVAPQDPGARHDWPLGAQIAVGNSLLELTPYFPPDAALKVSDDGVGLDYNRPPRLHPPEQPDHFRLPKKPADPEPRPLPWITAFVPLVGSVMLAIIRDRWIFLLLAVLTPIMLFGNYYYQKKRGGKKHAETVREYKETKERIERDAQAALIAERYIRRHIAPDPATVLSAATGPRTRLWERRRTDEDHLLLRVGTAELDSAVVLTDPEQDEHRREVTWRIADAPVTIPLAEHGVVGFAAPGDMARAMGRWAVGQLAVLHSPLDVQFYVLTDSGGQSSWEWLRWLPHSRPTADQDAHVLIGNDAETVGARLAELSSLLEGRLSASRKTRGKGSFGDPDIVIVFDGSRRLRSLPGVIRLLKEGPGVSMYSLCLDDEERFLPGECQAVAVAEPRDTGAGHAAWEFQPGYQLQAYQQFQRYGQPPAVTGQPPGAGFGMPGAPGGPPAWPGVGQTSQPAAASFDRLRVEQAKKPRIRGVRPDLVAPEWTDLLGRSLSPLRDISAEAEDAGLPAASRLLDVLRMEPPTAGSVMARWQAGGQSTVAVLGESYDGPFAIDLRRDGPHGLIAGTTGSGKSELLQTIVASLAVANTPENMTFVLVDYKGGAAFKDCVQLPHTVGMVTDLDNHLVERALRSLGAELTRREHILAEVGAKDIEDYQDLCRREPGRHRPMPRLLIVIDEFASMVRELPDFVKGLVNIAQRGRSLGIHLLLATQRPSGVISPEIRANTNLRIALRVTDPAESTDVIDAPDASMIAKNTPGRAYVRLGHASLVPFQSGRVGGRRPGAADPAIARPWSTDLLWPGLGRPQQKRPAGGGRAPEDVNTDLRVLVETVIDANQRLGLPPQHSPWLPPLPDRILLSDLPRAQASGPLAAVPYAIEDLPEQQSRRALAIDFKTFGHLLVAGAPRMGRSQLLRTIAGSIALTHSSEDVHLYGFDCGNGALNVLTKLPHCGAVVARSQVDRAKRLLKRLEEEVLRRQELLSQDALADITEQRQAAADGERLPHIVVLLDRWEGWTATLGEIDLGALTDQLQFIMREGASVGIHAVITGDQRLMAGRISGLSEDKFVFRMADRTDYAAAGLNARKLPENMPQGRMFRAVSAGESQVAVLSEDMSGQGQAAALTEIAERVTRRDAQVARARRPFRVDVLPQRLTFDAAWEMRDPAASDAPLWGLVGVGGDELTAFGPDLGTGVRSFVIAGPAKSGRSTVLHLLAMSLLRKGVRVVVSAPRESPMRDLEGRPGVLAVLTEAEMSGAELREVMGTSSREEPIVLLMDDAEDLRRCKADEELRAIVTRGGETGRAVVVAGDAESVCAGFTGWQAEAKKARRGVLLSPQSHRHGDLIGAKLSRSVAVAQPKPGHGILHLGDGVPMTVRIPVP